MTQITELEFPLPSRQPWPARLPFYYGWVNVVVAAVAMSATLPGRTYGLGLIKEPLCKDLGIGELRFDLLNMWAIIIGTTIVLPVGRLIDRFGTRAVVVGVSAALGACVLLMSRASNETELFVTLTLVRGLGQGALSVVAIALVGKWFRKRAGMAMGVFTVLLGVGFTGPILAVGAAVEKYGWRSTWDAVGLSLIGMVLIGFLFARSTPESIGVQPDDPAEDADAPTAEVPLLVALRTSAFWAYSLAATMFLLTFSALTLDNASLLQEHGLDAAKANGTVMGVLFLSGLPANFLTGWLARHYSLGRLLAVGVVIMAASLVMFPMVTTLGGAAVYAVLLGASGGVITVAYFAVYGHTYGRAHLGSIQAAVQVLTVLASAVGPVLLSVCREWFSRTEPFFYASAAVSMVLAVAVWVVRPPVVTVAAAVGDDAPI
jgi:MFS family permease